MLHLFVSIPILIARLSSSNDVPLGTKAGSAAMEWRLNILTVIATWVVLGLIVLVGVRIVRNVTDALISVEHFGTVVVGSS